MNLIATRKSKEVGIRGDLGNDPFRSDRFPAEIKPSSYPKLTTALDIPLQTGFHFSRPRAVQLAWYGGVVLRHLSRNQTPPHLFSN